MSLGFLKSGVITKTYSKYRVQLFLPEVYIELNKIILERNQIIEPIDIVLAVVSLA